MKAFVSERCPLAICPKRIRTDLSSKSCCDFSQVEENVDYPGPDCPCPEVPGHDVDERPGEFAYTCVVFVETLRGGR